MSSAALATVSSSSWRASRAMYDMAVTVERRMRNTAQRPGGAADGGDRAGPGRAGGGAVLPAAAPGDADGGLSADPPRLWLPRRRALRPEADPRRGEDGG